MTAKFGFFAPALGVINAQLRTGSIVGASNRTIDVLVLAHCSGANVPRAGDADKNMNKITCFTEFA
jgi:hypothetical protein